MSDRKYRQRGYQDSPRREEPRRGPAPGAPPPRDGPRGRGLGAPTEEVFRCARCGHKMSPHLEVAPAATCERCGSDLHACVNCRHFDTAARFECRQPIPARLPAKSKANGCERFAVKTAREFGGESRDPGDPRAAFDALFKL